jgi:hypothetical protein
MKSTLGWGWGLCVALVALTGCSQSNDAAATPGEDASSDAGSFGQGPCAACLQTSCAQQYAACQSDPGCSAWLQCLYDCPSSDAGAPDATCAAQCPTGQGSTTTQAINAFQTCMSTGPGTACQACGTAADAGEEGGGENPILHQQCSASQETDECWKCEDEHCCDTHAACKNDTNCAALVTCFGGCATWDEAMTNCVPKNPDGYPLLLRRLACVDVLCPVECGSAATPCLTCIYEKCANSFVDCYILPECFAIQDCVKECSDTACLDACKSAHPTGVTAFEVESACLTGRCGSVCE